MGQKTGGGTIYFGGGFPQEEGALLGFWLSIMRVETTVSLVFNLTRVFLHYEINANAIRNITSE